MKEYKKVLCIAGSENQGSSGVQADIKAVSACGAYGAGALTCVVNLDSLTVKEVFPLPVDLVARSVQSFLDDAKADAIKMGMLFTRGLIVKLGELLRNYPQIPKVVDPVMVATRGDRLIELDAVDAYKTELFPLATITTPNFREANLLLDHEFGAGGSEEAIQKDMEYLCQWGNSCIVKSYRRGDKYMDVLALNPGRKKGAIGSDLQIRYFEKPYIETRNVNGTGCTFSSSIAAFLAQGYALEQAVERAEDYIHNAIVAGAEYDFAVGVGPVCHFYNR